MMGRVFVCALLALVMCSAAWAADEPRQITAQSWHGLSGLYVVPTARMLGKGRLAMTYSESKHVEIFSSSRFMDRQVRGSVTYGAGDRLELCAQYQSNQYDVSLQPVLDNEGVFVFSLKALLWGESGRRPAVAFAVRDITDTDTDADPLTDVHNGRKYFLLASKRIVNNRETGRFVDAHIGLGSSERASISPLFGFELAVSPVISLIGEGMWDSPFVNFRESYVNAARRGTSDHEGRFIYDMGVRWYPDVVPGLVIDTGVVGDGSMEFSFGMGYVFGL